MRKFILFTLSLLFMYLVFLKIGNPKDYQLYAIISIFFSLLFWSIFPNKEKENLAILKKAQILNLKKHELLLIQLGLVVFTILNLYLVTKQTDFSIINEKLNFDFESFTTYTSIPLIIGAQFGGWIYQTILIFLFLEILYEEQKFGTVLKITGIGYLGFISSAIIIVFLNLIYLENKVYNLEEIQNLLSESTLHIMIAKSGDFITSVIIAIGIYNITNLNFIKSLIASFIPTASLSLIIIIFQHLF